MAAQFQLASAIIAEARYRFDIQGQVDRHPDADLLRSLNNSIQKFRSKMCDWGFEYFLKPTVPASLSITAAQTGETYSEQDWPVDAARIYGVHVLYETGFWVPLKPISLSGIRDYQRFEGGFHRMMGAPAGPCAFALRLAPFGATTVETVGKIIIVPKPRVARQYIVWYLENWTPIALASTFNGHEGWVEWILWDMGIKIATRDEMPFMKANAEAEQEKMSQVLAKAAPRTQMACSEEPRRADSFDTDWGPRELL